MATVPYNLLMAAPFVTPFAPGGAEFSLDQMCLRFSSLGWRVRVVTPCYDGNPRREERAGYSVTMFQTGLHLPPGQQIDLGDYFYRREFTAAMTNELRTQVAKEKPLALIANNADCYVPVADCGLAEKVPAIAMLRDMRAICETGACVDNQPASSAQPCRTRWQTISCLRTFDRVRGKASWRIWPYTLAHGLKLHRRRAVLQERGLRRCARVVAISQALSALIRRTAAIDADRVSVIYNFATQDRPADESAVDAFLANQGLVRGRFFLAAGKKSYGKGTDLAVAAIQSVRKELPDMRLLLLGKGQAMHPADASFVDHPSVDIPLLLGILRACCALVIPGRWQEGLHRTMLDAVQAGIPIICTEAGAPREGVEHGKNGWVIPCNDHAALSRAMLSVAGWNEEQRRTCRETSAAIHQDRLSDDVLLAQWDRLLNSLAL